MGRKKKSEKIKKLKEDLRRLLKPKWKKINEQIRDYRKKKEFGEFIEELNKKREQGEITAEEWRKEKEEWVRKHK